MTNEIDMIGIAGSTPIGFMAALGVLRSVSAGGEINNPRIYWKLYDDWIPVLVTDDDITKDTLVSFLDSYRKQRLNKFFTVDDIRMAREDFEAEAVRLIDSSDHINREMPDYWAAFASEMVLDKSKGLVKPTDFYMVSGQQKFPERVKRNLQNLSDKKLYEALFGPWRYDDSHDFANGWDPSTYRRHAFRKQKPSADTSNLCESGAEWLAFESIPLFPVFTDKNDRITSCFFEKDYIWPIWKYPASIDSVRTILLSREIYDENERSKLKSRGIAALYSSMRLEFAKGYGIFLPGELIWQA